MVPLLVPDIQDLRSKNSSTPLSRDYLALEACRDGDLARATRGPMTADRSRASSDRWSLVMIPAVVTLRYRKTVGSLRSEEHTSELQSRFDLVCRLLLEK